ncbi:hypothetical protein [Streptomyces sp. NPDC049590]|uniref:hypothetical protein n=1 Tax=Streptomyces sp. NPDC049590 TaxID=3154834 RepID=UPI003440FF44
MNTRITAVIFAAAALTLTACSGPGHADGPGGGEHPSNAGTPKASPTPSTDWSAARKAAGIPPEPTGAKREESLRALAAADPDIVKYEEKAIDAARNQCSAINHRARRMDWAASQRFTYKDVTTTEAQGKKINEALQGIGFRKV